MKNKKLIIAIIIFVLLIIGVGVYAAIKKPTTITPPNTNPNPNPNLGKQSDAIGAFGAWLAGLFKKKTNQSSYVQVPPIDERGCDSNNKDAIGNTCL